MSQKETVTCPKCGADMNRHAMKVERDSDDGIVDPVFGGVLKEAYYCPECGHTELRAS